MNGDKNSKLLRTRTTNAIPMTQGFPCQLLSLYFSILVPILSEWINDEDLCFLDTAVCSQELRNNFLKLLEQCSIEHMDMSRGGEEPNYLRPHKSFKPFLSWMKLRGIGLKRVILSWQPRLSLSKFKHLQYLECRDYQPLKNITADRMKVHCSQYWKVEQFESVGSKITDLVLALDNPVSCVSVAIACPNLLSISASLEAVLAAIDHCPLLDSIVNCNLEHLLKREDGRREYSCDLKRTAVVDESAVCLGGGENKKYFNLTGLKAFKEYVTWDVELPYLRHLTSLKCFYTIDSILLAEADKQCFRLTQLHLSYFCDKSSLLLSLVSHSPMLKDINISGFGCADPLLTSLSQSCPLLEICQCNLKFESSATLASLIENCSSLKTLRLREIFLKSHGNLQGQRYEVSLSLVNNIAHQAAQTVVNHYTRIRLVKWKVWGFECIVDFDTVFSWLHQLESVSIRYIPQMPDKSVNLDCLGELVDLTSLSLSNFGNKLVISRMFYNKSKLRTLALINCGCNSEVLSIVRKSCPNLTMLNLSKNNKIKNRHVDYLTQACTKLETLILRECDSLTRKLYCRIKSTSLKTLYVWGSNIDIRWIQPEIDLSNLTFRVRFSVE